MNARERAEKAIKEMPDYWDESYEEIINTFERTINAAIEEDRKTRECCKTEREACAQFLDRQAQGFQVLIDHAPTPIRAEDLKRVKHSIEIVAKQIRARSKGSQS